MLIEQAFSFFLRKEFPKILQLSRFENLPTPRPVSGKEYLAYIHVPFCEELCPYCSFNRVPLEQALARRYFSALKRELEMYGEMGFRFSAAYVGGGTPTVLPKELSDILVDLRKGHPIREVSAETNPNHLTEEIVGVLKESGVNRLSVGVQSFSDDLLKKMERFHKYGSGEAIAKKLARFSGVFDTLNADMIFNFPTQDEESLRHDLAVVAELGLDQVTFYPLMVSDMTKKKLAEVFGRVDHIREKRFYDIIVRQLEGLYRHGTAWCFSRKNLMIDEYVVDYDEYVGIGSGSFGYVGGTVFTDTFSIPEYLSRIGEGRLPLRAVRPFSLRDQMRYDFMMKLFGMSLDLTRAERKFGGRFRRTLRQEIGFLRLIGALRQDGETLTLTRKGRYLWVIMMREFFTGVNNFRDACRHLANGVPGLRES